MLEGFSAKGFTDDCEQSKTGAAESVPFAGSKWAGSSRSGFDTLTVESCHSAFDPISALKGWSFNSISTA